VLTLQAQVWTTFASKAWTTTNRPANMTSSGQSTDPYTFSGRTRSSIKTPAAISATRAMGCPAKNNPTVTRVTRTLLIRRPRWTRGFGESSAAGTFSPTAPRVLR